MACDAEQQAKAEATALRILSDIEVAYDTAQLLISQAINNLRKAQELAADMALIQCQMNNGGGMMRSVQNEPGFMADYNIAANKLQRVSREIRTVCGK